MVPILAALFFSATTVMMYQQKGFEFAVIYGMCCMILLLGGIGTTINNKEN